MADISRRAVGQARNHGRHATRNAGESQTGGAARSSRAWTGQDAFDSAASDAPQVATPRHDILLVRRNGSTLPAPARSSIFCDAALAASDLNEHVPGHSNTPSRCVNFSSNEPVASDEITQSAARLPPASFRGTEGRHSQLHLSLIHQARDELEGLLGNCCGKARENESSTRSLALRDQKTLFAALQEELEQVKIQSRLRGTVIRGVSATEILSSPAAPSPEKALKDPTTSSNIQDELNDEFRGHNLSLMRASTALDGADREALNAVYDWVRRADEHWTQSTELLDAQLKHQEQLARSKAAELDQCSQKCEMMERQLLHLKTHLEAEQARNMQLEAELEQALQDSAGRKQLMARLLDTEHKLEIEVQRREEVEKCLEAERTQHLQDRADATAEGKEKQQQTQRLLEQVSWQGDSARLQLAAEQVRVQQAEQLSNELAQEVLSYKKQLDELQKEVNNLQSHQPRLLLHQVKLREHKLSSAQREERGAILTMSYRKWQREFLQSRRSVQCARFLTAVRLQRNRLSRKSSVSISNDDVSAWVAPWAPTSHRTYDASLFKANHAIFRLPGAANGMGRRNGARLCASLDFRLLANAFEVFVDDARVARCARRRSTQVEKSFQRGKIQLFLGSTVGCGRAAAISTQLPFPRRRLLRGTKVRVDKEKDNAQHISGSRLTQKNFAHNEPDSGSGRDDAVGLAWGGVQGVAFWLWYQTGKLARQKQILVTRSLIKKNARLVATGFQAIKKFALICEAIGNFDESKTVLATMKYFRHWLVFFKRKLALDKTWMHLVVSLNAALLWKKKAQAMTLGTCWRRSLDAAVLLCTRAHSSLVRNDVLVRLALTEWRHTAILAALQRDTFQASRILRLISHAQGIFGGGIDIGDGSLTLHDCTGNIVLKREDAHLLWMRIVWKKWVASLRHHHHQKESARKRKISVRQRHAHAMMLDVLCHWDVQSSTARQRCLFRRCTALAGCVQSTPVSLDHSLHEVAVPSDSCTDYTADKLMVLSKAMVAWVHVRHWIDGVRLVCKFRLLSCHFSDWISSAACSRRQKRFVSITLQDRREKMCHRYFIYWVDGVRSDKNRLSLLLSFATSSIQGVECPGFVRRNRSKCIGSLFRTRGTEVRKWTRLTSAGLKIGFLCSETRAFGLKIFKAEFFALWACRSLREYEISGNPMQQRLRAVRRRLDLWCAQIQQRRTHAACLYGHVSYLQPQANALAAWRQVCTKSPRFSLMTKIIHQRARARKRILMHSVFVEWSQLAARTAKGLRLLSQVKCRRCILLKRWAFECLREGVKNDLEVMRGAVEAKRRQFQGAIDTLDQGQPFTFHVARTSSVATEDFEPYLPRTLSAMSGVSRSSSTADLSRTSSGGTSWNAILDTPASVTSPGRVHSMSWFPLEDSTSLHSPTSSNIVTPDSARVGFAPPSFIPKHFGQVSTSSPRSTSSLHGPILKRAPSLTMSEQGLEDIPQRKLHPEGEATVFGIGSESAGTAVLRLWDYGDKERIQKIFTTWCRNTALQIARKKKITKLARAMKEKFKRIQKGAVWRTCRSWFEQYNVLVALREERISDLKKLMDNRWLQVVFMDWAEIGSNLSARLRLVNSRANEACAHLIALVLHCWCCYARQSASQRNRADAKCSRNFHILKGSECLTAWLRMGKYKQSRRHKIRRQIAKARHKLLSQTFAEWFLTYNENRLEGLRALEVYQSQIICKAVALQRLFSRIRFAHTVKGFMAWEEWSLRSGLTRRLLIKAQHRIVKIQKGTMFECWCCQTQVFHRQRANLNAVIVRTRNLSARQALNGWKFRTREEKSARRIAKQRAIRDIMTSHRQHFSAWVAFTQFCQNRQKVVLNTVKLALRYFIGKAFTGWQNMVCEIKWHEGMLKKAAMKRSNLRLSRIFASWFDEHCTEGMLAKMETMDSQWRSLCRFKVLTCWVEKARSLHLFRILSCWRTYHTRCVYAQRSGTEKEKEAAVDAATKRLHSAIAKTAGETASKHADIAKNCRWLQRESASLQKEIQEAIRAAEFFFEAAWAACRERCSHADRAVFLATKNRDLILQELQELKGQENQTTQQMLHLLHRVNERVHADGEERDHARNVARTLAMRVGHLEHEKRRLQSTVSDLDSSYQNLLSTAHKALDHLESPESTQGKKSSFSSVFAGRVDLSGEGFDEGTPSQNLSLSGVSFA